MKSPGNELQWCKLADSKQEQDHTAAEGSSWGYSHLIVVWMSNCLYKGRTYLKELFSFSKMPLISEANCRFVMNAVKNHSVQDFHICDFWHLCKGRSWITMSEQHQRKWGSTAICPTGKCRKASKSLQQDKCGSLFSVCSGFQKYFPPAFPAGGS